MMAKRLLLALLFAGAAVPVFPAEPHLVLPSSQDFSGPSALLAEVRGTSAGGQAAASPGTPGLGLAGSVPAAAECVAPTGRRWLKTFLRQAMPWFAEGNCVLPAAEPWPAPVADGGAADLRPLELYENEAVRRYLEFYLKNNRRAFERGLRRSGRYLAMIREIFRQAQVPAELAFLAAVESNYNPRARSPRRATGLWQFMAATGRRFGLRVQYPWYDERLDPEYATRAAARLLAYLHDRYGSWELALAAYNAGEGRVNRAMRKARRRGQKPDYWNLRLPPQTRAYVPAFLALAKLYQAPDAFGFAYVIIENPVETERIDLERSTSLAEIAHRLGMPLPELVRLNPAWRRGYIPPGFRGKTTLRLPPGKKELLLASLGELDSVQVPWLTHVVEARETLSQIARGYGVAMREIMSVNPIANRHFLAVGQRLIIPLRPGGAPAATPTPLREAVEGYQVLEPRETTMHFHRVRKGESFWTISRRYGVEVDDLKRWNGRLSRPIRPSQKLVVFIPGKLPSAAVALAEPSS